MGRLLPCLLVAALVAGCSPRDAAPAGDLRSELAQARARIRALEKKASEPAPPPDPARYVDLWGGGPTMRGAFLALPRLGVLRWSCARGYFRIVYENRAATTHVAYDTPGPGRSSTTHPGDSVGATVRAGETVTWTITHRHPPGFIRARIAVTPERSPGGGCLLGDVELRETGRLYD